MRPDYIGREDFRDWKTSGGLNEFESGHDAPIENCSIMQTCQAIRRLGTELRWQLQPLALADVAGFAVAIFPEENTVDHHHQAAPVLAPCATAQGFVGPAADDGIGKLVDGDQDLFHFSLIGMLVRNRRTITATPVAVPASPT